MHLLKQHFHFIHIPPLLAIVLCFILGIICHTQITMFAAIFLLLFGTALFTYTKKITFPYHLLLYSFFIYAGAFLHQKNLQDYDNFYISFANKKIDITGLVIDKNEVLIQNKKSIAVTVTIDTISQENWTKKSNKTIMIYSKSNKNIHVGDIVTFYDIICKKPSNQSFQHYQIKEQIVATIFDDKLSYTIENHPTWSLRNWIWNQKTRILQGLSHKFSEIGFRFFSSLFLGNRMCVKASLEQTNEQFKTWGISHFLARSGLHLALFIFIWQAIFCIIPLPLLLKQILISLLSSIYFILTWTSAPFTRSFALFILNKICLFTKTPFHLLHYLTLVCFGFLLYCPLYLFFLDFQLSFALTFALAWFNQLSSEYKVK